MSIVMPATARPLTPRQRRTLLGVYSRKQPAALTPWLDAPRLPAPQAVCDLLASRTGMALNEAALWKNALASATISACAYPVARLLFSPYRDFPEYWGPYYPFYLLPLVPVVTVLLVLQYRWHRRAAQSALELLVSADDPRAVLGLARLWTPRPLTRAEAASNADVSRELSGLLSDRPGGPLDKKTEKELRRVMHRAFPAGRAPRLRPQRDLSEVDTAMLLGIVRHLSGDLSTNRNALRRAADFARPGANYALLRDTAQTLLRARPGK